MPRNKRFILFYEDRRRKRDDGKWYGFLQSSVHMIKQNTKLTCQFGIGTTTDGIPILLSDSARDRNSSSVKICRYVICMYM